MRKYIIWIVLGALVLLGFSSYNGLVSKQENVGLAWGNVESDYQRRADLIPNLVNTVKGYANFEQETLTKVMEARASATQVKIDASNLSPENIAAFQQAQGTLSSALGRLLAVAEAYPDLKANQNILQVQEELTSTENKIAFARQGYNDSVTEYNTKRESFPDAIFAGMFGFNEATLLEATESAEERKAPKVSFK